MALPYYWGMWGGSVYPLLPLPFIKRDITQEGSLPHQGEVTPTYPN